MTGDRISCGDSCYRNIQYQRTERLSVRKGEFSLVFHKKYSKSFPRCRPLIFKQHFDEIYHFRVFLTEKGAWRMAYGLQSTRHHRSGVSRIFRENSTDSYSITELVKLSGREVAKDLAEIESNEMRLYFESQFAQVLVRHTSVEGEEPYVQVSILQEFSMKFLPRFESYFFERHKKLKS